MSVIRILCAIMALIFTGFAPAPATAGSDCTAATTRAARTACEVVRYNAGRDTSVGTIGRRADYCDAVLRRDGEPLVFRWARGRDAWAENSRPLRGLVWAGRNKAGERFRELGLSFADGRTVVETELCADRKVWRKAIAEAGISRQDIATGRVTIFLCGERWAHRIPPARILAIIDGRRSRGQYSVLSKNETRTIVRELTKRGF